MKRLVKWYARRAFRGECAQTDNEFGFTSCFSNSKRDIKRLPLNWASGTNRSEYTPSHNGKVERSHRQDQKRFYFWNSFFTLADFEKQ